MIPYAELSDALERYRKRMGLAPSGSAMSASGASARAEAPAQQQAWGGEDQTSVSGRGAIPGPENEPMDNLVDPPSGAVDVGDMDILDEEPQ